MHSFLRHVFCLVGVRLFSLFHAHTTSATKERVLSQLNRPDSFLRVVFATTALGMGVNTYFVKNVIHISPPSSLEAYFQEVGHAGRSGDIASAHLYYNNSDIATNTHVQTEMRDYCRQSGCMRKFILNYFGFEPPENRERCCSNCIAPLDDLVQGLAGLFADDDVLPCRSIPSPFIFPMLLREISMCLMMVEESFEYSIFHNNPLEQNCAESIINGIEYFNDKYCLLEYGISDEKYLALLYDIIDYYCPLL